MWRIWVYGDRSISAHHFPRRPWRKSSIFAKKNVTCKRILFSQNPVVFIYFERELNSHHLVYVMDINFLWTAGFLSVQTDGRVVAQFDRQIFNDYKERDGREDTLYSFMERETARTTVRGVYMKRNLCSFETMMQVNIYFKHLSNF